MDGDWREKIYLDLFVFREMVARFPLCMRRKIL